MITQGLQNKDKPAGSEGWERAVPEQLPEPVYWPFFLAMGIAFIFWGLLTIWVLLAAGGGVALVALAGWVKTLNDEQR